MKKIIVMGVGNYILSDEGVGIHVIKELEKMQWPENVEIYDCGTTGILSFHKFVEADILIAVDAIALKEEPGTIKVYNKDDITAPDRLSKNTFSGRASFPCSRSCYINRCCARILCSRNRTF